MGYCPLCGSKDTEFWKKGNIESVGIEEFKITDYQYGKHWELTKCRNCHFIFSNPFPPAEVKEIYEKVVDPEYVEEEEGRGGNFRSILKNLKKIVEPKGPFLDVGCATGIMMNLAKKEGWDVYGVELSSWAVEEAKRRYGLEIIKGDFLEVDFPENFFQVIALIDIIEHVSKPKETMEKVWRLLRRGGICVVVTPDVMSLTAKIMGEKWWHFRPAHIGFFSKESIFHLLHSKGFEIVKVKRYKWRFSLYYISSRIKFLKKLAESRFLRPILKRIPIILPLMDSLEIYGRKP